MFCHSGARTHTHSLTHCILIDFTYRWPSATGYRLRRWSVVVVVVVVADDDNDDGTAAKGR